jgi:hypothetical protein
MKAIYEKSGLGLINKNPMNSSQSFRMLKIAYQNFRLHSNETVIKNISQTSNKLAEPKHQIDHLSDPSDKNGRFPIS